MAEKISRVSSGRYLLKKPYFSAFLFPGGAPPSFPTAFLFPGCPPRFLFERSFFFSERSFSHLWVLFQRLTVPSGSSNSFEISMSFIPERYISFARPIRSSGFRGKITTSLHVDLQTISERQDSNLRPAAYKADALPAELRSCIAKHPAFLQGVRNMGDKCYMGNSLHISPIPY